MNTSTDTAGNVTGTNVAANPVTNTSNNSSSSKYKYHVEIQQMMFVSGETHDPPLNTTAIIEDIVRGQVVEILMQATKTAASRGSKSITSEDMIFLIRHDKAKVNRLRTYLSWKDVRKNAKDQDSNGMVENTDFLDDQATAVNEGAAKGASSNNLLKQKKSKLRLPWEMAFMFNEQALDNGNDDDDEDEEEREAMLISLKRLKNADDRTRGMTREEYVHFSECRQASFTFRKGKRFKEWCGTNHIMESKPSDDVIDILGFLTFEMVCSITEHAMKVKQQETSINHSNNISKKTHHTASKLPGKHHRHLFDGPGESVKPLQPYHIEEAWRRLQIANFKSRALLNFKGGRLHSRIHII